MWSKSTHEKVSLNDSSYPSQGACRSIDELEQRLRDRTIWNEELCQNEILSRGFGVDICFCDGMFRQNDIQNWFVVFWY